MRNGLFKFVFNFLWTAFILFIFCHLIIKNKIVDFKHILLGLSSAIFISMLVQFFILYIIDILSNAIYKDQLVGEKKILFINTNKCELASNATLICGIHVVEIFIFCGSMIFMKLSVYESQSIDVETNQLLYAFFTIFAIIVVIEIILASIMNNLCNIKKIKNCQILAQKGFDKSSKYKNVVVINGDELKVQSSNIDQNNYKLEKIEIDRFYNISEVDIDERMEI